ncbi:type VI secretion system-associated FHA domain protein TagH [Burkholderia diffusa]|uniref:FHA domain-containing protein n=1 Tax=Burkholderia diffusa TaxID=488732 RepID=A0A6P2QTF2_9BURK|nr:type VI secretion system-associated FHA domain protein TagH [Burkholderia diffusa]KAB0657266.1 type VI secretion system-associated FHA domain protein TagH [Burkholderia diffusa]MBM2654879.1 type VI secretion system-associated FHA domain protein TagH [Burkholderia diffusa]VWC23602.1 FHA domain-containing protein [Burkholderia diffusa]
MNTPTPPTSQTSADTQRLELIVANTHALRAGSTARHRFGHAGGTIGSRGADWLLDDGQGQVQAIHCEIAWIDNSYCVRDQSGATRVNDAETPLRRGMAARLRDGDMLHIGAYQVTVHLQTSEPHLLNSQPLQQRSVGELLNEPSAGLHPVGDADRLLDAGVRKPDFSAFDDLAREHRPADERDPLAALDAEQLRREPGFGVAPLDPTNYGLSPSQTQANHARTRFEAVSGSPKTLSGESTMPQSYSRAVSTGDANALIQPLVEGLGASVGVVDPQMGHALLQEIGRTLSAVIHGITALQHAQDGKRRNLAPLARTLQPIEDNPLRLGLGYPETVRALFSSERSVVHLSPSAAVEESLAQVQQHQAALIEAIEASLQALLRAFSPEQLQQRFQRYRPAQVQPSEGADWSWQMYTHYYNELTSSRQQGFEKLFWEVFEQAYDRALRQEPR